MNELEDVTRDLERNDPRLAIVLMLSAMCCSEELISRVIEGDYDVERAYAAAMVFRMKCPPGAFVYADPEDVEACQAYRDLIDAIKCATPHRRPRGK